MVDIVGKKNYYFVLSAIIFIAGIIGYIVHGGFNYDIQFQGGTVIEMEMKDDTFDASKAETIVENQIGKKITAQKSYTISARDLTKKMHTLILSLAGNDNLTGQEIDKVVDVVRSEYKLPTNSQMTVRNVNPSIGTELKANALWAVFFASVFIIIYIWIRFKVMSGLSAGVIAICALLHDIAIMISVYTIFDIRVNESFIAAVLTILGYSMNDTIIIYDRIRENSNEMRRVPIAEMVNKSIIQTLARSINTVVTVLICLITVYVFAWYNNIESIREFAFPLIVGVASGAYSSIFIASPLWVMWKEHQKKQKASQKKPAKA